MVDTTRIDVQDMKHEIDDLSVQIKALGQLQRHVQQSLATNEQVAQSTLDTLDSYGQRLLLSAYDHNASSIESIEKLVCICILGSWNFADIEQGNEFHSFTSGLVARPALHSAVVQSSGAFDTDIKYRRTSTRRKRTKPSKEGYVRLFRRTFFSYSIQLSFMKMATEQKFAFGPVLEVRKVIPHDSAVFKVLQIQSSPIISPDMLAVMLPTMRHDLDYLFRNGEASINDVDVSGESILDVSPTWRHLLIPRLRLAWILLERSPDRLVERLTSRCRGYCLNTLPEMLTSCRKF